MMKRHKLHLLALACAAIFLAGPAVAARLQIQAPASFATPVFFEKFFAKKKAAAPTENFYYIHDDASFAANTNTIHLRPADNPLLEFDISLPKNWAYEDITKTQTLHLDQSLVTDVVALHSESIGVYTANAYVSVQTVKYEISAKNWLKSFLLASGFAPQGEIAEAGPHEASAFYTTNSDKGTINAYIRTQISGNVVMSIRCELPLPLKDYTAYLQKKLCDSLQVSYFKEDNVEEWKPLSFIEALKFSYPASWVTEDPDFKDMSRLSVSLRNEGASGTTNGFIRVMAIHRSADTSLTKELETLKKHFSDFLGINITKLLSSGKADTSSRFIFSKYEVYAGSYKKEGPADPEIHLAALGDKDWYVFVYMITPTEQNNLQAWARNTRTFELFVKSMH